MSPLLPLISYLNKMNLEELREYCLSLPHVTEDMPFDEDILVFRICNRIFVLTSLESVPLRVSLKCDPERAIALREQYPDKIVAGYHLNKKLAFADYEHGTFTELCTFDEFMANPSAQINKIFE